LIAGTVFRFLGTAARASLVRPRSRASWPTPPTSALSDAIAVSLGRYQTMPPHGIKSLRVVATAYRQVKDLILTIAGIRPGKGHEPLHVVGR